MLHTSKYLLVAGLAGLMASPLALADSYATLGGNLGYYRFDYEDFPDSSDDFDDERSSWKVYLGLQPSEVIGLELGYANFGKAEDGGNQFESDGITAAATASIPFSENFAVYGKLGQLFWEREARAFGLPQREHDGSDTFYGVGTRLGLAPNLDLKLEYERYKIDRADVDMASIGLGLNF